MRFVRLMKSYNIAAAAERHAIKTQHLNFSESTEAIKPLTAEEKAAKIERVQELLKIKRAERLAREKEEEKEKEKVRRKTGQELSEIREKVQMQEQQKALAERERHKQEDRIAKERIKAQLEADKLERARQAEERKRGAQATESPKTAAPVISASHSETRIQIRLPDGQPPLTQIFNVDDTFATLLKVLSENRTIRPGFKLVTTFPRKIFGDGDKAKTLKELNLVPSAALVGQY